MAINRSRSSFLLLVVGKISTENDFLSSPHNCSAIHAWGFFNRTLSSEAQKDLPPPPHIININIQIEIVKKWEPRKDFHHRLAVYSCAYGQWQPACVK
jgi:hypothetical protein